MKSSTKHAISALCISAMLLAIIIYLDRNGDGVDFSMWLCTILLAASSLYAAVAGLLAISPERKP